MLVEVNPLLITKDRQVVALDAKVTIDDNALFRHPDTAELRNPRPRTRRSGWRKERGLTYVKLDGNIGILGNGAGLVMSHARRGRPGGRRAGELPRRRRRLQGRGDRGRGGGDPLQREGHGRAVQHLRRDHALRRGGQRPGRGVRASSSPRCRSWCASTAPTTRRGARSSPRPTCPTCTSSRRCSARPSGSWSWRGLMSILVDKDTKLVRLRPDRPRGQLPRPATTALRHRRGGRRDARQGRARTWRASRCSTRSHDAVERDRRQHGDDLRAAALRRRLDPRGRRRRHRARSSHHRGHPGARHAARLHAPQAQRAPRA